MTPPPQPEPAAGPSPAPGRRSAFHDVPWRWSDVAVGVTPLLAARAAAFVVDPASAAGVPWWAWWTLNMAGMGWMLAYPVWTVRRRGGPPVRLPSGRRALVELLFAAPLLLALWVVLALAMTAWMALTGATDPPTKSLEAMAEGADPLVLALSLLTAVTVAPVAEEVFFRGMLFNALRRKLGGVPAAVLQAAVFGLVHTFGATHSVSAGLLGLAFAGAYAWRKTLLAPILLHFLQNTTAVAFTLSVWAAGLNAPFLGLAAEPADGGARVVTVVPGSGAEEAGLRPGDVVTAVDGRPVADIRDVIRAVRAKQAGDRVAVEYTRDGQPQTAAPELKVRK